MRMESEVARYLDRNAYAAGAGGDEERRTTRNLVLHMFRERCPSHIHVERPRGQSDKQEKRSGLKIQMWSHR